jgi:hypothetical protein
MNFNLYYACKSGSLQEVEKLIELGADNFNWGLSGACEGEHLQIINRLIELGADNFDWCLYWAYMSDHFLIAKKMIELGAKFGRQDHKEWYLEQLEIEEMFIEFIGPDLTCLILQNL